MPYKKLVNLINVLSIVILFFSCSDSNSSTTSKVSSSTIVCNQFDIKWELNGRLLRIALETDLPDYTDVMVSVSRGYKEVGNSANYSINYYSTKGKVSEYRSSLAVLINDAAWQEELSALQKKMAGLGSGFRVKSVEEQIKINFTVPINQASNKFGANNSNLTGHALTSSDGKTIRKTILIDKQLEGEFSAKNYVNVDELSPGKKYQLSKTTPLMPELNPRDPEQALEKITYINAGSSVKVQSTATKDGSVWYFVETDYSKGWINSTALIGQGLLVVN